MESLETIRQGFERLLATTAEHHYQLEVREQELAAALELTRDSALWRQCQAEQRRWFQELIATQLSYLRPNSCTAIVLHRLSQMVEMPCHRNP
jgi:hypothetical protein